MQHTRQKSQIEKKKLREIHGVTFASYQKASTFQKPVTFVSLTHENSSSKSSVKMYPPPPH
jgi:hypothetical protein